MRGSERFRQGVTEHILVLLLAVALTAFMTWPLASLSAPALPDSDDAYFSTWRLAWVAHQLPREPQHLFDANMFYPARDTLAYSDAMLLLGVAAAPLFWLDIDPARIHNALMLLAFVTSMYAAYLLCRRLTNDRAAAILGAVIFAYCPYRFAHIGHLELQWVLWMPLGLLLTHRLFETPRLSTSLLLGLTVAGQILCSVYYGVFLAVYLSVAWLLLAITHGNRVRVARFTAAALLPLLVVVAIYGPPYARARTAAGPRAPSEISEFSARPGDYLRVPPENRLRGARPAGTAADERSLFPGAVALLFAAGALWPPISRVAALYGALALIAFDFSLGINGWLFPGLQRVAPIVTSLRSPARFSILVALAVAVLAALAAARLRRSGFRGGTAMIAAAVIIALVEYYSPPRSIRALPPRSAAHFVLASLPPETVVLELPVPSPDRLWLYETTHQVRSIRHWRPLVNGYSGFAPREYTRTLEALRSFPDERSIQRLRELGVDLVMVNREFYEAPDYEALTATLRSSPQFEKAAVFDPGRTETMVISLKK